MKKHKKEKILFVTPSFQSFILNDLNILEGQYEILINNYNWKNKKLAPIFLFRQVVFLLTSTFNAKFIIVSFGGYWSFFPALFGLLFKKKVFIILHGTDCASLPEISYGSLRIPLLRYFCKKSYEMASCLLPVSESLIRTDLNFSKSIINKKQGILNHFPRLKTPFHVIHNGLDPNFWQIDESVKRLPNQFFAVISAEQYYLKGADLILKIAPLYPECSFYIAGMEIPKGMENIPKNVGFLGKLNPNQLKTWYQSSTFYFQLSLFEGFGCALVEAMLCGCISIGSNVNHIPQIIGVTGFVLERKEADALKIIIDQCLDLTDIEERSLKSRRRMIENYTLHIRTRKLLEFLNNQQIKL